MRIVSFGHGDHAGVGLLDGDRVLPLPEVSSVSVGTDVIRAASPDERSAIPLRRVVLRSASPSPRRILCVGLNYHSHVEETRRELPTYPVLFPKFAASLIGPDDPIIAPPESHQIDYEGELAVVIGRAGRRIQESDAMDHVLGFSVANDVTMRDYQYRTHQWLQGKAWDNSTPVGPAIVTPDEVDLTTARIRTTVNGDTVQNASISQLIFSVERLLAVVSEFTRVEPGDVILTGTPGGVGFRREPQLFLQAGDVVAVEIDGIGRLENRVVAEAERRAKSIDNLSSSK